MSPPAFVRLERDPPGVVRCTYCGTAYHRASHHVCPDDLEAAIGIGRAVLISLVIAIALVLLIALH